MKMTPEHKKKIGEANKRGKFTKCVICSKDFWIQPNEEKRNTGIRKCCNRACFKKYYKKYVVKRGCDNYFWGWKGNKPKGDGCWSYVKKQALERDKWTCRVCGFMDKEIMQVDHIKERKNGGKDTLENVQTLCPNCHARKTVRFLKCRNLHQKNDSKRE